jgi:hypothetical protein
MQSGHEADDKSPTLKWPVIFAIVVVVLWQDQDY